MLCSIATANNVNDPQQSRPIRIALLTNLTTTLSLPMLRSLSQSTAIQLCHVLFYDTVSESKGSLRKVLREQGLKATAIKGARWLARSARTFLRDKLAWPVGECQYAHEYAEAADLPFSVFPDMNRPEVVSLLKRLDVDILLVCSCRQILNQKLLHAPRMASINLHPSLLPKYRGPVPIFWTLYHGEPQAGVTFHLMNQRIDDGDVIAQFTVPIHSDANEQDLTNQLFETAAEQVENVLNDFVRGQIKPQPQPRNSATYQSYPTALQRRQLLGRHR